MFYFDHNAASPVIPEVLEAIQSASQNYFANPSSLHYLGREARHLLEEARKSVAQFFGVTHQEIVFTSGGSECNNMVLRQVLSKEGPQHIVCSVIEHPSVLETCRLLETYPDIRVSYLPVDAEGVVSQEALKAALEDRATLVSVMHVNNETGVIQPIETLAKLAADYEVPFHTDAVQSVAKVPLNLKEIAVDYASLAIHKVGGPRGIGVLYIKQGNGLSHLISGGDQERMLRAGTESVALAHGMASTLEWHQKHGQELHKSWKSLKQN